MGRVLDWGCALLYCGVGFVLCLPFHSRAPSLKTPPLKTKPNQTKPIPITDANNNPNPKNPRNKQVRFTRGHAAMKCYGLGLGLDTFRLVALDADFRRLDEAAAEAAYRGCVLVVAVVFCRVGFVF